MNKLARPTIVLILLVVCHRPSAAQQQDLAPLLPAAAPGVEPVRQAVLSGDIARAATLAAALPDPDRGLWRGILAILRNDHAAAIRLLRPADAPKLLGVAYYLARQHLLFRDQMREAIRRDPADFGLYYYLGRHYDADVADAEAAAAWFRLALDRNPGHVRSRSYLGSTLERLGQTEAAAAAYSASLSIANSQLGLARLRVAAGRPSEALAFATKAMALEPANVAAAKLTARIYGDLQRPRDAIRTLETAAGLAPADASIRYQLFRLYQANAEPQKAAAARTEFQRLQSIYGTQP